MSLTFYHNLKDALGTIKKGEALCTNSYLALFPLTIVYKRNNPHDKYIGQRLLTSRVSNPDVLSFTKSKSKRFDIGQVLLRKEGTNQFLPVPDLSGDNLSSFYLLSILRSDDLLSEVGDLISAVKRNKNVFTSHFVDFALSGLREIKSLGGDYVGLGTCYRLLGRREYDDYWKYSKLMELIRESVLSSLSGLDLDLRDLDYSLLEDRLNEYLSSVTSGIVGLSLRTEIEFIDRRLVGTSSRLVASKWFNEGGLSFLDHEGYDHLTRALSDGINSLGSSVKDLKEIVPDLVGHFLVNLSFPNPRSFVAVPIRRRPAEITKSSKTLEVDYLVFFKVVVDQYEFMYSPTRGLSGDQGASSLSSLVNLAIGASGEVGRNSLLLEEYLDGEPNAPTDGEKGETNGKSVVVDFLGRFHLSIENKSKFLSLYRNTPLERLNPPDPFIVRNDLFSIEKIYYNDVISKRYVLSFDFEGGFGVKLKGSPRSERLANPETKSPTLGADFFVGDKIAYDIESSSKSSSESRLQYSLDPGLLGKDLIEKAYEQVGLVHSLVLENKPELAKEFSSRGVHHFLSVLEVLERALKNLDPSTSSPSATFSYSPSHSSVFLKVQNPVSVVDSSPSISPEEELRTFDSASLRCLRRVQDIFSRGGDLCARVGKDTLKLYFWEDLGDEEVYTANLLSTYLEKGYRPEVEVSHSKKGLKTVDPIVEDFSWGLSSLVLSSLITFERDNLLELDIPQIDIYTPYLVNELVAKLTENRERDYIYPERRSSWADVIRHLPVLVKENFIKSVESVYINIEGSVEFKISFSLDQDRDKRIHTTVSSGLVSYTKMFKVQAFYLPSGVRGKRLKLVVG